MKKTSNQTRVLTPKTSNQARVLTPKEQSKNTKKTHPPKKFVYLLLMLGLTAWAACAFLLSGLIVSFVMALIFGADFYENNVFVTIYTITYDALAIFLAILPPALLEKKWRQKRDNDAKITKGELRTKLGLHGLPTWTDIGLAPIGLVVTFLVTPVLMALFSFFPWFNVKETQSLIFEFSLNDLEKILIFISLVIVAPIAEELVFRGWLYGELREKSWDKFPGVLSVILSIFLVSLAFGILHGQWNVGITVFVMSVVMCGLREITGTIYSGILLHMLKNGIAFILIYVLGVI